MKKVLLFASMLGLVVAFQNCGKKETYAGTEILSSANNTSTPTNTGTVTIDTVTEGQAPAAVTTAGITITKQPGALSLKLGDTAVFSVAASGTNLTYQWYRNNVKLAGQVAMVLSIAKVTKDSAGQYQVEIKSAQGSQFSYAALLQVIDPSATPTPVPGTTLPGLGRSCSEANVEVMSVTCPFASSVPAAMQPTYRRMLPSRFKTVMYALPHATSGTAKAVQQITDPNSCIFYSLVESFTATITSSCADGVLTTTKCEITYKPCAPVR